MNEKRSYDKENKILAKTTVTILSVLLVTFSITSMQILGINNNEKMTLIQEASAEVSITKDIDKEGDCDEDPALCVATQTITRSNAANNGDEDVKIDLDIDQLLECGDSDCITNVGGFEAKLDAKQTVQTASGGNSRVDYDVDMEIDQDTDGDGQDYMKQNSKGEQLFKVIASDTATVDADGDGKDVRFTMTQTNDECDDSFCDNGANQYYNFLASGGSKIIADHNSGFNVVQTNNGCDDDDGDFTISCVNKSLQGLDIQTSGTTAQVFYDSLDPDDDTNDVIQTNNCDFGIYDCVNDAAVNTFIKASDTSKVTFDDVVQDVSQNNNCEDLKTDTITPGNRPSTAPYTSTGCGNKLDMDLSIYASLDGVVTHEGDNPTHEQEASQSNECDNADCFNVGIMSVALGSAGNPVDGLLKTDYTQDLNQQNDCTTQASCFNYGEMKYTAFSDGSAKVTSVSNQDLTQSNNCHNGANCANFGTLNNNILASGTATLTATANQDLTQSCSKSGGACLNNNILTTSGTATGTAILSYTANQNIDAFNHNDAGAQMNTITANFASGTHNLGTISQTTAPDSDTFP
jgi:hypothetical protein